MNKHACKGSASAVDAVPARSRGAIRVMCRPRERQHPPPHATLCGGWSPAGHQRRAGLLDSFARQSVQQFLRNVRVRAHAVIVTAENALNSFT